MHPFTTNGFLPATAQVLEQLRSLKLPLGGVGVGVRVGVGDPPPVVVAVIWAPSDEARALPVLPTAYTFVSVVKVIVEVLADFARTFSVPTIPVP